MSQRDPNWLGWLVAFGEALFGMLVPVAFTLAAMTVLLMLFGNL